MRTVLASALRRRECARSLHQLYAAAAGAAASGGTIPLSLGDHQHDLLHAPQLLGRIKRGIEGRRILCALGVSVIFFWSSPGTLKDLVGRHQSNAIANTLHQLN